MNDFFLLAKQELALVLIIFLLLIIKVGSKEWGSPQLLGLINLLLLLNLVAGFLYPAEGILFNEMFHTGKVIILEKNILNAGTLIVSWLATVESAAALKIKLSAPNPPNRRSAPPRPKILLAPAFPEITSLKFDPSTALTPVNVSLPTLAASLGAVLCDVPALISTVTPAWAL